MTLFVIIIGISISAAIALAVRHFCVSYVIKSSDFKTIAGKLNAKENRKSREASLRKIGSLINISQLREQEIQKKLIQAGIDIEAFTWIGIKVISIISFGIFGVVFALFFKPGSGYAPLIFAFAIFVGYAFPKLIISSKKRKREREIAASLPATLELLSTTVHAGYPLERGIRLIGSKMQGELANEFRRVDMEINYLNMPLDKALERLKERCDTPSVTYFANAMIQSYRQGTSIVRSLEAQAQAARNQYYSEILVKINQLPSKMVPVIFVIFFPIIIAVSVLPVVYNAFIQFASLM